MPKKQTRQPKRPAPEVKVYLNKLLWLAFDINKKRGHEASVHYSKQLIEITATGGGTDYSAFVKPTADRAIHQLNDALIELTKLA